MTEQESAPEEVETETGNSNASVEADAALTAAINDNEALMGDVRDEEDEKEPAKAKADKAKNEDPEDDEEPELEETEASSEEDEPEAEEDEESDEDEEGDDTEDEDELLDAMALLRKETGAPTSALKTMPRDKLIAWANRVAAQKEAAKSPEKPATTETDDADASNRPADSAQGGPGEWGAYAKAASEALGVDEEAVTAAFKPLHDGLAAVLKENKLLRASLKEASDSARARETAATIDTEMRRLERTYPGLGKDEALREKVINEATTLALGMKAAGRKGSVSDVFDRAAKLAGAKRQRSDMAQLKRNGTSSAPTSRPGSRSGDYSEDDYFIAALDMADRGQGHRIKELKLPSAGLKPRSR